MFGHRTGDRRFQLLVQMRLKFGVALIAELLHHPRHCRGGNTGIFGNRGDAAEAGHRIIAEQAFCQPFFGTCQRVVMGMDDVRHGGRGVAQIFPLPVFLPVCALK